jgi:hypothetical protein
MFYSTEARVMGKSMKLRSILCAAIIFGLTACSGDSTSISASDVPEGKHWQVTVDGSTPEQGTTLFKQHLPSSDKLFLTGTGSPDFSSVLLIVPMEKKYQTGVFEKGVEIELPGAGDFDHCELKDDSDTPNARVSVNIMENSRELFVATFTFTNLKCNKEKAVVTGSGFITQKRAAKK